MYEITYIFGGRRVKYIAKNLNDYMTFCASLWFVGARIVATQAILQMGGSP